MMRSIDFLFALFISCAAAGQVSLRQGSSVATGEDTRLLADLFKKIESLESRLNDQKRELEMKIHTQRIELEEKINVLQLLTSHAGRNLAMDDEECYFMYNNVTDRCVFSHMASFEDDVEMLNGFAAQGNSTFNNTVYMMDGAHIQGSQLLSDSAVKLTAGFEVMGNSTTTFYGSTTMMSGIDVQGGTARLSSNVIVDNGFTVKGSSSFEDVASFSDTVTFTAPVGFTNAVDFDGKGPVSFAVEVTFEDEDVYFNEGADVFFKDDVTIDGPSSSSDSIDFDINGHVDVNFNQKEAFDVFTLTRFREDVEIKRKEKSKKSKSKSKSTSTSTSTSTSSDDVPEHMPSLLVGGDITTYQTVHVGDDIMVTRDGSFGGDVTIVGEMIAGAATVNTDLTVTGDLAADSSAITGAQTVGGSLTVTGTSTMSSGATVNGDLVVSGTGTFADVDADTLDATGDATVGGNLVVGTGGSGGQVAASEFVDCTAPTDPLCPNYVEP